MLKLWGRTSAFNVQKIMWFLKELELDYEPMLVGGKYGGLDSPEFLAMNPHGRIPVLQDKEVVVWESHAILRYLAATYSNGTFWPTDPVTRSINDRWMDWAHTTLQPAFMKLFWGYYRTPEDQRDLPAIEAAIEQANVLFLALDHHLSQFAYMTGPGFTLADIPVGTTLYRYFHMGLPTLELEHVRAWYQRLAKRPAYQTSVMLPFEELKGRSNC